MSYSFFGLKSVSKVLPGYRTTFLIVGLCLFLTSASGEVTISLRNSSGIILKPEAFLDLDIINNNTYTMKVYVQVDLYDVQRQLMRLTTDFFILKPGLTSLTSSSVIIRNNEYYDEAFKEA